MGNIEQDFKRYRNELLVLGAAATVMKEVLEDICKSAGVLASVQAREKSVSSFVKKALTKEGYLDDPWGKTTDKVGARIIVETLNDRERIVSALDSSSLDTSTPIDKEDEAPPKEYFYPGVHIQALIPGTTLSDGEPIECEIQIRTKAQDLWSVPSHKLIYKGVVTPEPHTERRVWRLQSLTSLFDEEVQRAVNEILSEPGYEQFKLISIAEDAYFTFVPVPGDRDLSYEVLLDIGDALVPDGDFDDYKSKIDDFASSQYERIAKVYETYGESSDFTTDPRYWLFTQPESILILEGIHRHVGTMRIAAQESEYGDVFEPLFRAWGVSYREPLLR